MAAASEPVLAARGIVKRYGAVRALDGVNLELNDGEALGLVGDNGAGKSTLLQILAGSLAPDGGSLMLDGREVAFRSPQAARDAGIEAVYQDLALAPDLTVSENLFLGREILAPGLRRRIGLLDRKAMARRAREAVGRTNITIGSVDSFCGALSGGQRQAVAVARAVAWGSKVVLMDEPTAALGFEQQKKVAQLVEAVQKRGVAVLLVSHNLPQLHDVCDRIAIMFRGRVVRTARTADTAVEETVLWMMGGGTPA